MIARRSCDHAPRALLCTQRQELVQGPPLFVSTSPLPVLQLQINRVTRQLRERLRTRARCNLDRLANPPQGGLYVGKSHHSDLSNAIRIGCPSYPKAQSAIGNPFVRHFTSNTQKSTIY